MKKLQIHLCLIVLLYCSCKEGPCCTVPLPYTFTIVSTDGNSYFGTKPELKIFTLEEGEKVYLTDLTSGIFPDTTAAYKYKYFWNLTIWSSKTFKKNYYLELPGGDIDTLYLDVRSGINLPANVFQSNFNGKPIEIDDQSIKYWQIHLLNK